MVSGDRGTGAVIQGSAVGTFDCCTALHATGGSSGEIDERQTEAGVIAYGGELRGSNR